MDELLRDTSIARTSSGSMIAAPARVELSLDAVCYVADLIIESGYMEVIWGHGDLR